MNVYPQEVKKAAQKVLDNEDFRVLLHTRLDELRTDLEEVETDAEILTAATEIRHVKAFADWISHIGEGKLT